MPRFNLVVIALSAGCAPIIAAAGPATAPWTAPSDDGDDKYFAFHKPGVELSRARADIQECLDYMTRSQAFGPPPKFVLLGDPAGSRRPVSGGAIPGGLAGEMIAGMISRSFAMKTSRGNLRRCMSYKGYTRYAIDKAAWSAAFDSDAPVEPLAALAAGDAPKVAALRP